MPSTRHDDYIFPPGLESDAFLNEFSRTPYIQRRQDLWRYARPRLERFTYKYAGINPKSDESIDRARDIIVRSRFWLSSPNDFNDPFDCKVQIVSELDVQTRRAKIETLLRTHRPNLGGVKRKQELDLLMAKDPQNWFTWSKKSIESQIEVLGVTCLTDDPRNLLMWSHYSKEHTGVSYQFEVCKDLEVFARAIPVRYTLDYPTINFYTYTPSDLINIVLSKFVDWKYEKERRIVAPSGANKFLKYLPISLTGIILGAKSSPDVAKITTALLQERHELGLPEVAILNACQHSSAYKLRIGIHSQ